MEEGEVKGLEGRGRAARGELSISFFCRRGVLGCRRRRGSGGWVWRRVREAHGWAVVCAEQVKR